MKYFLAHFRKGGKENGFYQLILAGNLLQAVSRAEREHPEGYEIVVTEALVY